jgi:LCP family protein required for cell wall assembly
MVLLAPLACLSTLLLGYVLFPPTPVDIVILGVDARPGQRYLTRTDSIMLLNVTPEDLRVSLLSIPRDVFIRVPNYGEQRINTINVLGEQEAEGNGPALVKASLEESFGIKIDRYIRLDFNDFAAIIDAVGGIDIEVPKQIVDYEYPTLEGGTISIRFDPGVEHMDGERALQYARTRHQDSDYERARRQQQVIDAVLQKLSDPRGLIYWPAALSALLSHTDTDLTTWDMVRIGPALLLGWPHRHRRVLEGEDLIPWRAGYYTPDYDALAPWIEENFD